jgi:hypothetical protein
MTKKFRIWGLVQDRLSPAFAIHVQFRIQMRKFLVDYYEQSLPLAKCWIPIDNVLAKVSPASLRRYPATAPVWSNQVKEQEFDDY